MAQLKGCRLQSHGQRDVTGSVTHTWSLAYNASVECMDVGIEQRNAR